MVSSGFVSRGWALIQSIASCSEVNLPKWCTDRLAHTIFTRQILPSCTGDNRALIDASMIRPARSDKPYPCPFSGRNARGRFFHKICEGPLARRGQAIFAATPASSCRANANLTSAHSDQTNNKQTSNKSTHDFRINVSCCT
jgi:hypothetical protein